MKTLLATLCLITIAPDRILAEPLFARRRCRAVARQRLERVRAVADRSRRVGPLDDAIEQGVTTPSTQKLFNGRDLSGWSIIEKYDFARHGEITVQEGAIVLGAGKPATGIRVDHGFPRLNYEVTLDAKRIEGSDFFCGITFPVGEDYLSLVLGGWGGGTTGISNLDNMSAVENQTTGFQEFESNRWYRVRLRVTEQKVEAWIDEDQIVDVEHRQHKLSIWWEQEPVRPFGVTSWYTTSAIRDVRLRRLDATMRRPSTPSPGSSPTTPRDLPSPCGRKNRQRSHPPRALA